MNAESSDWKRFIPVSDELNLIYEELDDLSKQQSFEESDGVPSPLTNRHVNIFDQSVKEDSIPHIEQQLKFSLFLN